MNLEKYSNYNEEEAVDLLCMPINLNEKFLNNGEYKAKTETSCLKFAISNQLTKFVNNSAAKKCFEYSWYGRILPIQEQIFNTWPKV